MAARRTVSLVVLVMSAIVLWRIAPVSAQDGLNSGALSGVRYGITDGGPVCSAASILLDTSGALTGQESPCFDERVLEISGGHIAVNGRDVTGDIGGDSVIGHLLPAGHGFVAVTSLNTSTNASFPTGAGLATFVEPNGRTFTENDLIGTWRIKALVADALGGLVEVAIGSVVFGAEGTVTAGDLISSTESSAQFVGGNFTVFSDGRVVGLAQTRMQVGGGEGTSSVTHDLVVNAVLAPDRNFGSGVLQRSGPDGDFAGTFFMQREPTVAYSGADLEGTWRLVSLQAALDDSTTGGTVIGTLTFDGTGHITGATLMSPAGVPFPALNDGTLALDLATGFIEGSASFADGSFLGVLASMFQDKKQIIGVNAFGSEGGSTLGLFTMFKQGPPPPASTLKFGMASYKVREGGTVTIPVTRSPATNVTVTVDYQIVGNDTVLDAGTLTFAPGQASRSITFTPAQNVVVDGDRTLRASLSNPTHGGVLGTPSIADILVVDDDSLVELAKDEYVETEGAKTVAIGLTRRGGLTTSTTVRVWAMPGTAVPGQDFTPISSQLVTFAANAATASFAVRLLDDTVLDGERTILLRVEDPALLDGEPRPALAVPTVAVVGPRSTATLRVMDNDRPGSIRLASATYTGNEGTTLVITIQRQAVGGFPLGGNVSVEYRAFSNGSAVADLDFAAVSGTVTFVGTQTTKTVAIALPKDDVVDGTKTFEFALSNPTQGAVLGTPSTALITANDIDKGGVVTLGAGTFRVGEGAGTLSVTVKRSGGVAANASVEFATVPGTATDGADYGAVVTTLTFGAGELAKVVTIPIVQDLDAEGNETFRIVLSNPQGGLALGTPSSTTATIVDDESAIQFEAAIFSAPETSANATITLVRSGALGTTATVSFTAAPGTAQPGLDFKPVSTVVTFLPGQVKKPVLVPLINNKTVEGDRTVLLSLAGPTGGAQLGTLASATLTIRDNDQGGVVRLGSAAYTAREGATLLVRILRALNGPGELTGNASIDYVLSAGNESATAGLDYVADAGTVVFKPGETFRDIPVRLLPDPLAEGAERLHIVLSNPTGGASLASPSSALISIVDDDVGGVVSLSPATSSVSESAGSVTVRVVRTGGAAANASVDLATVPVTAVEGGGLAIDGEPRAEVEFVDYIGVATTLTFAANETVKTVSIPIVDDELGEGNETFRVVLSNPQGGLKLGAAASATVAIVDDEVVIQFSGRFSNNQPEVVRSGPLTGTVSVEYLAASGTAQQGDDFILTPGTLVFPAGVRSRMIPIKTVNDVVAEGPETFSIALMNPSAPARLGPFSFQEFVLNDNDFGGTLSFGNTSPTAVLGETKALTIVRTGGLGTVLTVGWSVIGGTAVPGTDFSPASGQVTFLANQLSQTFLVDIASALGAVGKTIVFGLTIPGADAARLGTANTSTLTILDSGAAGGGLELVSRATGGTRGNADSGLPATSADGRSVAFISAADNLAPRGGDGFGVYVRDHVAGTTELITADSDGFQDGDASAVAISGDGRYVAFVSTGRDLVIGDGNGLADVFVRDRVAGTTQRVSMADGGGDPDGASIDVTISADGRVVAFTSLATNLVRGAANGSNVYVFDRVTGTTELVGAPTGPLLLAALALPPTAGGRSPALSADGRFVVFLADGLFDTDPSLQVGRLDRATGTLELISQNDGTAANGTVASPAITADGALVAYVTDSTNLGTPGGNPQVYVYDPVTGVVELISRQADGTPGNGASGSPSFSAHGRFVAFVSAASNLVPVDTNGQTDVFVHDRATGLTQRINVLPNGTPSNGLTDTVVLSGDGTFAAFATTATSLSSGDLNNAFDVLGVTLTSAPPSSADIAVTNTVDVAIPALGATVTFTVTATNTGPAAASGIQVTALLPAGYAFVSATPSQGTYASGTGLWTVGSLASTTSATLSIRATVLAGGPYATVATRTASSLDDPNPANDSATATVTPQAITLTTDGPLVGVGRTIGGTVSLPTPAATDLVVTLATTPAGILTVPPTVAVPGGASTAPFAVAGVAVGSATITGTAAGLASGNTSVTVTSSVISLGALAPLGPGQTLSLPISLSVAAPAGGVTVTFTSTDTSIATVTASVFIPAGSQVPAANPQVTGVAVGSANITASATGFAPDTRAASVVVNVSFSPSPFSVVVGTSRGLTVTLSAPAPAGGFTVDLATANASAATVASPVTVQAGQTSVQATVTGVAIGSTTMQASGSGLTSATVTINVTAPPPITLSNQTIGQDLQVQASVSLGAAAPAGGLAVTLTSADASRVVLSTSRTAAGSGSIVLTVPAGTFAVSFYVQALAATGTVGVTASAAGYQNGSATVTLAPSGFIISSPGNFSTTSLSTNTGIVVASGRLNPTTLAFAVSQELRGGSGPVSVVVTATDQTGTGVGAITASPVVFNAGDSSKATSFDPSAAGISLIQVATPSGFSTSTTSTAITATVSAPRISLNNLTIGKDLQVSTSVSLEASAPAGGLAVTLTSGDPSRVVLSTSQTAAGSGAIVLTIPAGGSSASFYVQALADTGTVGVTGGGPGYQNGSATVTLVPSGFIIASPAGNFSTTTLSGNTSIQIASVRLSPSFAVGVSQELRGGIGPVNVDVVASDQTGDGVGTITASPVVFNGGDSIKTTSFDPNAAGTSQVQLRTPAGFSTPATSTAITATVDAPTISIPNRTVGKDLQTLVSTTLGAPAPAGGLSVTLRSSDPSKVVLSTSPTAAGEGSIVISFGAGTSCCGSFYVQALDSTGTVTVSASAPAYQTASATITLGPSGFVITSPVSTFSTTTFSTNTTIRVNSALLNAALTTILAFQDLRGGISPVIVPVTATDLSGGPGVGTITSSPLTFAGGDGFKVTEFDPAAAGTSLITLGSPAGFSKPEVDQAVTATVTAPAITVGNPTVGRDLQQLVSVSLGAAPPSPVTVTVTVASTAIATITRDGTVAGGNTVTFTNVTSTSVGSFYVQGRTSAGTTTLTTQAPGYTDAVSTVTTRPSGFIIQSPGNFTTTAGAGNTNIQIVSTRLDPTTLNAAAPQEVRGGASVDVAVSAADVTGGPRVGAITVSPLNFTGGVGSRFTQFDPAVAGTSRITVGVPPGFDTPSNSREITATVNP